MLKVKISIVIILILLAYLFCENRIAQANDKAQIELLKQQCDSLQTQIDYMVE